MFKNIKSLKSTVSNDVENAISCNVPDHLSVHCRLCFT